MILPYNVRVNCWTGCPQTPEFTLNYFPSPCVCVSGVGGFAASSANGKAAPRTDDAAAEPARK